MKSMRVITASTSDRPRLVTPRVSAPLITTELPSLIAIAIMSATVHPITDDVEALSTVPKDDVEAKNVLDDDFLKKVDLGAAKLNLGDVRSALRSKCMRTHSSWPWRRTRGQRSA